MKGMVQHSGCPSGYVASSFEMRLQGVRPDRTQCNSHKHQAGGTEQCSHLPI